MVTDGVAWSVRLSVYVCLSVCYDRKPGNDSSASSVAEMGDRSATIDMTRRVGADVPLGSWFSI